MPKAHARYDADQTNTKRTTKKIDITQPDGPGFEVEGNLSDGKVKVRASVNPDEGPVLHQLSLDGRPMLHRVALDMVVPYDS